MGRLGAYFTNPALLERCALLSLREKAHYSGTGTLLRHREAGQVGGFLISFIFPLLARSQKNLKGKDNLLLTTESIIKNDVDRAVT